MPLSFAVAKDIVKRTFADTVQPQHPVVAKTYKDLLQNKDRLIASRKGVCLITHLRSGHCKHLAHYSTRLDDNTPHLARNVTRSLKVKQSNIERPFRATISKKMEYFGKDYVDLGILSKEPETTGPLSRQQAHCLDNMPTVSTTGPLS